MKNRNRMRIAGVLVCLCGGLGTAPAWAQINLSGVWSARLHEDEPDRLPGPELGDYSGIPLNAAARLHAESWDASLITLPDYQCRVHPADYAPSFADIRIWQDIDRDTQNLVAIHIHHFAWGTERTIWMDGRPHPPDYALHTAMGFSTGKWDGDILTVTTTHLKEGWIRRNGVPRSDNAVLTEQFIRHGDQLTWVSFIQDPAYLTEPMIRSRDYVFSVAGQIAPYPCEPVEEVIRPKGVIPHHLPGTNTFLKEYQVKNHVPEIGAMGGAETIYPDFQKKLRALEAQPAKSASK
ncbi:MAG TPA: hypothetical protein VJ732_19375 [Bryobacteraceae bacterium]|nr:hypothetical protein [Bryobacteraceae bacterium]